MMTGAVYAIGMSCLSFDEQSLSGFLAVVRRRKGVCAQVDMNEAKVRTL